MSKIYAALEFEQRERGERHRPTVTETPRPTVTEAPRPMEAPLSDQPLAMEEEMVVLSHTIDSLIPQNPSKVIQFISAKPGEGTTTLIQAFAMVATVKLNKSVLLLAPDLRQAPVDDALSQEVSDLERFTEGTTRIEEESHNSEEPCLFVYPVSMQGTSLSAVFSSRHTSEFLDKLRQRFDLILVDAPAANTSADGLTVACHMDGVVLVVEAENARWQVINTVKDKLTKAGGNVLGVVFNKRRCYLPSFIDKRL